MYIPNRDTTLFLFLIVFVFFIIACIINDYTTPFLFKLDNWNKTISALLTRDGLRILSG